MIVASAIPIAIFCNVLRVAGQGLLDHYVSMGWSEGFAHSFAGVVMLIPALFLILLVAYVLDNLFIEAVDDKTALRSKLLRRTPAGAAPQETSIPAVLPPRSRLAPPEREKPKFSRGDPS